MDAVLARLVTARRHHATTVRGTTDHQRTPRQLGAVALFNRGIKRVHVYVDDLARRCSHLYSRRAWCRYRGPPPLTVGTTLPVYSPGSVNSPLTRGIDRQ